jgi:hypothetical protein
LFEIKRELDKKRLAAGDTSGLRSWGRLRRSPPSVATAQTGAPPMSIESNFKSRRARERELNEVLAATRSLEAGHMDHMFADQETKDAMRTDLKRQAIALIQAELEENPGLYRQLPDGQWERLPEQERKVLPFNSK